MDYRERRKLLRKLERLYETDPEFREWVDKRVEEDLEEMHVKAVELSDIIHSRRR